VTATRVEERVILADCCEDWILEWGDFYTDGATFRCPECGTEWEQHGRGRFVRQSDERVFVRERLGGAGFEYLGAEGGPQPITNRCCAKILLRHGEHMPLGEFACPVCSTAWTIGTTRAHGLRLPTFAKDDLSEPLTVQPGRTRPFLVSLSRYSAPRE
jgi:predicted RNA-binding Zn-ribbon protein involved in translation (DUF1610 family)